MRVVRVLHRDAVGRPTFVRALGRVDAGAFADLEQAAKAHVLSLASLYDVQRPGALRLRHTHRLSSGAVIVGLAQEIDALDVLDAELGVLLREDGSLVAISGTLIDARRRARPGEDELSPEEALGAALHVRHGERFVVSARGGRPSGPRAWVALEVAPRASLVVTDARARRALSPHEARLVPVYVIEHAEGREDTSDSFLHRDVVHAGTGALLEQRALTASDAFTYRVFVDDSGQPLAGPFADVHPHPTGSIPSAPVAFVAPSLVSVETRKTLPLGEIDPWLSAGATETQGNNVDAYTDFNAPSGLSAGDFRATTTSSGIFDRVYDTTQGPMVSPTQQHAAITQAFYTANFLHDYWYDSGFDEAHGNAQNDNFGRGGAGGDAMRVELQDGYVAGSRDNANMSTPEDGMPPRMQIYVWSAGYERTLSNLDTSSTLQVGSATFGPQVFEITGELVVADDGVAPSDDACSPIMNDVAGKLVLVARGSCNFILKTQLAEAAGAIGVIVENNIPGAATNMSGSDPPDPSIPTLMIRQADGQTLRAALATDPPELRMRSLLLSPERDGALDAMLVAHEWGHYFHHRLARCGAHQCRAMSEGFGDFVALHATLREGDAPSGVYAFAAYSQLGQTNDAVYFGLRRVPYSTDTTKNALSFRHITTGEALPATHPMASVSATDNAQVHNAGEVWATALFEVYGAVLAARPFEEARRFMADALVASLLTTPSNATYTEARDALITAMAVMDEDTAAAAAEAFARRGLGTCAVSPGRDATSLAGVVEDLTLSPSPTIELVELVETDGGCDADGILDRDEEGSLRITLTNAGPLPASGTLELDADEALALEETSVAVTVPAFGVLVVEVGAQVAEGVELAAFASVEATLLVEDACEPEQVRTQVFRLQQDLARGVSATTRFLAGADELDFVGEHAPRIWRALELDVATGQGAVLGIGYDARSDTAFVTPAIEVGDDDFVVRFSHRFKFETSSGNHWDGLVVEYTSDGGASWHDVTEVVSSAGYNGVINAGASDSMQVLTGRSGYVGTSPSYPDDDEVELDFGGALAGETIALRFRIGSDVAVGDEGFRIRSLELVGAASTPFAAFVAQAPGCGRVVPEMDAGVTEPDAGEPPEPDGGVDGGDEEEGGGGGCGCTSVGSGGPLGALLPAFFVALVLVGRRGLRGRRA